MMRLFSIASVALLALTHPSAAADPIREERVQHAGAVFRVVTLEPKRVQLVWQDPKGKPFRTFERVRADRSAHGETVKFLMNAGIFEPGGVPSGLHIENARELHPLNSTEGAGNFFLKPNGVLAVDGEGRATLVSSIDWQRQPVRFPRWGLQSGPMLLIQGARHPAFREGSESRLHRNGVGIDAQGRLVVAITAQGQEVNLWDFAGLFLKLGCRNALFLDGDISAMAVNPKAPLKSNLFGAMLMVSE